MDEDFFCYSEDVGLGFRMQLAGYRCHYIPAAQVVRHGSAITGRYSDFSTYYVIGNETLYGYILKNMPWSLFWLYLPQHILINMVTLVKFSFRGQARVIFKEKWNAIKGVPRVFHARKFNPINALCRYWGLEAGHAKGLVSPLFQK